MEHRAYAAFCVGIQMSEAKRYREALQWFEKALSLDPRSADAHIWAGVICDERLSRRNKAKTHFEKALQLAPDSFRARYGIARQLLRAGKFEKARQQILLAIGKPEAKENPDLVAKAYLELALRSQLRGKRQDAADYYIKAAEISTSPAYILLRLGRLYRSMERHQDAADAFLRLAKHVPTYARAHRELCTAYTAMGEWNKALESLLAYMAHRNGPGEQNHLLGEAAQLAARALRVGLARQLREKILLKLLKEYTPDKAKPRLCADIASTLERLGRLKQAEPYLRKAVETAEPSARPGLRMQLALLYEKLGRSDEAIRELKTSIDAVEPRASIRYRTALCAVLESAKKPDQAEKTLEAILDMPLLERFGHAELGLFHKRRGNTEKAAHHLQEAIKLADTRRSVRYRIELGQVYAKAKRDAEAERVLRDAHKMFPENAAVNNALGWFYAERSINLDTALTLIQTPLKASPKNPYYIDSLGWVYFKQGRKKAALEQLRKAVALTDDGAICDHLGDVYMELGQRDKASHQWKRSLELDPKIKGVREKLKKLNEVK